MGMFDSLYVECPDCKESIEFQSKAGRCILSSFNLSNAPAIILADLEGQTSHCQKCDRGVTLKLRPIQSIQAYIA